MGFTDDVLKKKADGDAMRAAMIAAICGNLSEFGVKSVELSPGVLVEVDDRDGDKPFVEVPFDCHVLSFSSPWVGTHGPNPWKDWREASMSDHLDVGLVAGLDPTALVVRDGATVLEWLNGSTLVVTSDAAAFASLRKNAVDMLPGDARRYVDIKATAKPFTAEFVARYWRLKAEDVRLRTEHEQSRLPAEAASHLKQAAKFLILARATGAAEQYGLTEEMVAMADGWAEAYNVTKGRERKLAAKASGAWRKPGALVYDVMETVHTCEQSRR